MRINEKALNFMTSVPQIFDRKKLALRRARAAENFSRHDFLIDLTAERLVDRMLDFSHHFSSVLIIGGQNGLIKKHLKNLKKAPEFIVEMDLHSSGADILADEEMLPIRPQSFDCIIAHFALPFVNDVPGVLMQLRLSLKPDGILLASTLGTQTLENLRDILMTAELETYGGVSHRVGPFVDMQDMAAVMQRSGFALPVIDQDIITVEYSARRKLLDDLRGMGWSSCLTQQGRAFNRALLEKIELDQPIEARFETLYLTARAPSEAQQKPLPRGSGQTSLADHLTES